MSPARRRDAVRYLVRRRKVSERRACRLLEQHRSTQRYAKVQPDYELRLVVPDERARGGASALRLPADLVAASE